MEQTKLDLIIKIIRNGAPALANELIEYLIGIVNDGAKYYELIEKMQPKEVNDDAV